MSCSCKSGVSNTLSEEIKEKGEKQVIFGYLGRSLIFLLFLVLLPLMLIFVIYFMFKTIVLNHDLSITEMFGGVLKVMKRANSDYDYEDEEDDEDDEYFESLTPDDVILYDVEDLTQKD